MLLVIPLPCRVSSASPRRDNPFRVLSLCSCSVPGLCSDRWHNRLPWSLLQRGHLENCHQTDFLGAIASSAPSLVPHTHLHLLIPLECCQTLLVSSACGAWLAVGGSVSVVGIWDLGRQMALELELKPFQQCHSDFRLLLPCG